MPAVYKRKLSGLELVGLECCLFAIPIWCAFWFAMIVNDLQRGYGDTLREGFAHISLPLYLLALAWVALMAILHHELLRQWRKQILAEASGRKN